MIISLRHKIITASSSRIRILVLCQDISLSVIILSAFTVKATWNSERISIISSRQRQKNDENETIGKKKRWEQQ